MIAIIDYGMGNIHSVNKALQLFGAKTITTSQAKELKDCEKIVLPGVGAFADAMKELEAKELVTALKAEIKKKKPFLGICLGMQLLFQESEEASKCKGLGILRGGVKRFPDKAGLKIPHMGWNQLQGRLKDCPLLKGVPDEAFFYFCHSYYPQPSDAEVSAALTDYGIKFSSVVWQDNTYGVQFHPEKSQKAGLKIIENFVKAC